MVCVLFYENATLPQTRTKIVRQIFELTIERTILKQPELKEVLEDVLLSLGELSWKALQSDVQQLLIPKVRRTIHFSCKFSIYDSYSEQH